MPPPLSDGFVVWLTGLSGAGKSSIANRLASHVQRLGRRVEVLDGDIIRAELCQELGFSREDRNTNIRRIGFLANLLARNGVIVIVAAISPYREVRQQLRSKLDRFVEVYVCCAMDELIRRDTKGLYARALRGELANFTGVSDPYEAPLAPEVTLRTDHQSIDESVGRVIATLEDFGWIRARDAVPT